MNLNNHSYNAGRSLRPTDIYIVDNTFGKSGSAPQAGAVASSPIGYVGGQAQYKSIVVRGNKTLP